MTDPFQALSLDHHGYLVRDTIRTLAAMAPFRPRVLYLRQPLPSQKAFITMLELPGDRPLVELVEPFSDNAAMLRKLDGATGSLLYHCGYVTKDFEATYQDFRKNGWVPITFPFIGTVPGRKLSHLYHREFGLIEIMDPMPADLASSGSPGSAEA